ncbi:putative ribosome quality control (RQC) complex YloA/Tae2 family protein [Anaerosolibacter carboniphilus]|uniref:Rqc2 homolog RqcH n=1 Tax=Anaerosolibacter carboniphilus TaxID=1417629 RepID=A0A841KUC1_9FIRM|nr:NFACT RNA binding domain-containing protein [Anaerosolibacter carboniphilus]MBB6216963.1 putative ribosome quality control (RQC) complex YloA/Tae2 family protein [Anaerosolibacter carboniphilus]
MPLDGLVVSAIVDELNNKVCHGKIEKVYQPEDDEINLLIRCMGKNYRLVASASSHNPRVHITTINKQNPSSPPMFCMLMRKHLQGGKITAIEQKDFERIITIDIENYDELGSLTTKQLIIEIMGKHSNIILIDKAQNKILDSIKRISGDLNRYREILPGKTYIHPPDQGKANPLQLNKEDFIGLFQHLTQGSILYKALYTSFQGISPITAMEICKRAEVDEDTALVNISSNTYEALWHAFDHIMQSMKHKNYVPNLIRDKAEHHVVDFSSILLKHYEYLYNTITFDSISRVLEDYYFHRDLQERLKQKSVDLRKFIQHSLEKLYKKLQKLSEDLRDAERSEDYRIYGELLTANLHLIRKGATEVEVVNYYDEEGNTVLIPLDVHLSPSQNAQRYFKRYGKSKTAIKEIHRQVKEAQNEIKYFENILVFIENATEIQDLDDVRSELIDEGYLKKRKEKTEKNKGRTKPLSFTSSDGFEILVGKNNKQNDELTLKMASKKDLWLHTKDIPGSHVIVISKNLDVPDKTILEAATLAAFHSKGKLSENVPVDYTEVRNVRKPNGAKPGMVIYESHRTIYVTPTNDKIDQIINNKTESN